MGNPSALSDLRVPAGRGADVIDDRANHVFDHLVLDLPDDLLGFIRVGLHRSDQCSGPGGVVLVSCSTAAVIRQHLGKLVAGELRAPRFREGRL